MCPRAFLCGFVGQSVFRAHSDVFISHAIVAVDQPSQFRLLPLIHDRSIFSISALCSESSRHQVYIRGAQSMPNSCSSPGAMAATSIFLGASHAATSPSITAAWTARSMLSLGLSSIRSNTARMAATSPACASSTSRPPPAPASCPAAAGGQARRAGFPTALDPLAAGLPGCRSARASMRFVVPYVCFPPVFQTTASSRSPSTRRLWIVLPFCLRAFWITRSIRRSKARRRLGTLYQPPQPAGLMDTTGPSSRADRRCRSAWRLGVGVSTHCFRLLQLTYSYYT